MRLLSPSLAIIGIIYGALVAMVQPDVKKLVAYSSVSHLGFVVLGIFSRQTAGIEGSVLQMVNHGLSTGGLFLLVGMLYERRHTRLISEYGGLWRQMPIFAVFFLVVMFSSIGLPGLNGFVGEFLILLGTFEYNRCFAVLAASGIILGAVYMLWMYQRVMYGEITHEENRHLSDLSLSRNCPACAGGADDRVDWRVPEHVSAADGRLHSPSPRADAGEENHGGATL